MSHFKANHTFKSLLSHFDYLGVSSLPGGINFIISEGISFSVPIQAWWTFRIFLIFSARGKGGGSPRCQERGGVGFLRGGLPGKGGGELRGREGVCRKLGEGGVGGAIIAYFFSWPKFPPRLSPRA